MRADPRFTPAFHLVACLSELESRTAKDIARRIADEVYLAAEANRDGDLESGNLRKALKLARAFCTASFRDRWARHPNLLAYGALRQLGL